MTTEGGAIHQRPSGIHTQRTPISAVAPIIAVKDLWHTYLRGTPLEAVALNGAEFELREREVAAIIGHDSSGKSTLVQHLNGCCGHSAGASRWSGSI